MTNPQRLREANAELKEKLERKHKIFLRCLLDQISAIEHTLDNDEGGVI